MRDALSILERCIQDGENKIDEDKIKDLVGIPKITYVNSIVDAIIEYDIDKALKSINEILEQGKDLNNFLWEIIKYIKDILIYKSSGSVDLYSEEEMQNIKNISEKVTKEKLVNLIYEFSNLENDIKWSTQKTIMFQAGIIKLCNNEVESEKNVTNKSNKSSKSNISMQVSSSNAKTINNITNNSKSYSKDLSKSWPKIVNDLKQNGKIVLYTNLMNTKAEQINEGTVGIKFQNGITAFGKAVLEKQENIKEISNLVSMACGKDIQIKYISDNQNQVVKHNPEDDIQKLANQSDIPFNIID